MAKINIRGRMETLKKSFTKEPKFSNVRWEGKTILFTHKFDYKLELNSSQLEKHGKVIMALWCVTSDDYLGSYEYDDIDTATIIKRVSEYELFLNPRVRIYSMK